MSKPEEQVPRGVLHNIIHMIQQDPAYYRNFGVYWWRLKKILRDAGFDQRALCHLGDYTEQEWLDRFQGVSDAEILKRALKEQYEYAVMNRNPHVVDDPDTGENVTMFDQDAGL